MPPKSEYSLTTIIEQLEEIQGRLRQYQSGEAAIEELVRLVLKLALHVKQHEVDLWRRA